MRHPPRGRSRHIPGVMNRQEHAHAAQLEAQRNTGKIDAWLFEPLKLRIGDKCFYTPDFLVINADGTIEFHEVKGHWEDDARVKIKVAASKFPWFGFLAIDKTGKVETIRAHHSEVRT